MCSNCVWCAVFVYGLQCLTLAPDHQWLQCLLENETRKNTRQNRALALHTQATSLVDVGDFDGAIEIYARAKVVYPEDTLGVLRQGLNRANSIEQVRDDDVR